MWEKPSKFYEIVVEKLNKKGKLKNFFNATRALVVVSLRMQVIYRKYFSVALHSENNGPQITGSFKCQLGSSFI